MTPVLGRRWPRYDDRYQSDHNRQDDYRREDQYNEYQREEDRHDEYRRDSHPGKIEIIDNLIGVMDIMMREGPMTREEMKKINHIIIDFKTTRGMITEDLKHPDNFILGTALVY